MLSAKMESQYSAIISFRFNMKFYLSSTGSKRNMNFDFFPRSLQIETWHLYLLAKGVCSCSDHFHIDCHHAMALTVSETPDLCFNIIKKAYFNTISKYAVLALSQRDYFCSFLHQNPCSLLWFSISTQVQSIYIVICWELRLNVAAGWHTSI